MDDDDGKLEYVTPRVGPLRSPTAMTVPKASKDAGGMLADVHHRAKMPGPDHYNKDHLEKSFSKKALGGTFGKLSKEPIESKLKSPPVGHYNTIIPEKVKGAPISKRERSCYFIDVMAKYNCAPAPNKYDSIIPSPRIPSSKWDHKPVESRKTESMKVKIVGPGHYSPTYTHSEKRQPSYLVPKNPSRSFLEEHLKQKDNVPAPGTHTVEFKRVEDRAGRTRHAIRLLGDRIITPRALTGARQ
jgi:hypothetical protein